MCQVRKRLFFALWPDTDCRQELIERTGPFIEASGGRPVRQENLHLTLAFLHSVDVDQIPFIVSAARRVEQESFKMDLIEVGCWPRSRILWLRPAEQKIGQAGSPQELSQALWRELVVCGFPAEERQYEPHVSLARKINVTVQTESVAPIGWSVRDFALVQSVPGRSQAEYVVLQTFALGRNNDIAS